MFISTNVCFNKLSSSLVVYAGLSKVTGIIRGDFEDFVIGVIRFRTATMSGHNAQKHMVFLLNNGNREMISSDTRELECLTLPHPKGTWPQSGHVLVVNDIIYSENSEERRDMVLVYSSPFLS